jgi:hypothetical protein
MHPIGARAVGVVDHPYAFEEQTKVIERYSSIDVRERSFDHLLELGGAQGARPL